MPLQSDVALLLADYKELVLRYEALSRAIASRPTPSPPQPAPVPAPTTSPAAYSVSTPAFAATQQPQMSQAAAAAAASIRAEGAAPHPTEGPQFIQRSEESAMPDLLGGALAPSAPQDSGAASQQSAVAAFDPFGDVADTAHDAATDRPVASPATAPPTDPFLALERAASAMGPPSSGVHAEQDAESELAAFRAELPAAEPNDAQRPSTAAPASIALQTGPVAAASAAGPPDSLEPDAPRASAQADVSSAPQPSSLDSAVHDASQPRAAVVSGSDAVPGSAASGDSAAWAASWADDSREADVDSRDTAPPDAEDRDAAADQVARPLVASGSPDGSAEVLLPADTAPEPVQEPRAGSDAPTAAATQDASESGPQKPSADDALQPASDSPEDDVAERPSVPNGLHAADAHADEAIVVEDDQASATGLFAGLDIAAKSVEKGAGELENGVQAAQQPDDQAAQHDGF